MNGRGQRTIDNSSRTSQSPVHQQRPWHYSALIAIIVTVAAGILVFVESPLAFYSAVIDGLPALGIVVVASAAGLWLVWASGNGDLPVRWQIGLGAGFGLGLLSLGMLMAGLHGYMGRRLWIIIMALLAIAGIAAIYRLGRLAGSRSLIAAAEDNELQSPSAHHWRWLWLLIVPAIVLGVLAATVPPGLLWHEEGNGYDVLEYHLGVPKEYFFHGRIDYLDHNMYSNFPMNAEMLYLLSMILHGSPFKAAITAQMIHLLMGSLAGYAAWLIGRDYSRKAGILAGIAGVAFPWSIYLGALAYVENGMLFYGLLAAGLCNRAIRDDSERNCFRALVIGAMVGLACGFKYTAIPMIAVPLLGLWVLLNLSNRPAKFSNALIPLLIAATFFAPWMSKNQRMTGDPFFPLGYRVFGSRVWTDAEYTRFQQGHAPLPAERPLPARLDALWNRVIIDPRWGYVPWSAALLAACLTIARTRKKAQPPTIEPASFSPDRQQMLIWLTILVVQILLWLFTTHLFARFASILWVPLVFVLSILADRAIRQSSTASPDHPTSRGTKHSGLRAQPHKGSGVQSTPYGLGTQDSALSTRRSSPLAIAALLIYLAVGQGWLFGQYRRQLYPAGQQLPVHGNPELFFFGQVPGYGHLKFINGDGTADSPGLPFNCKLLMVGDARIFYVNRPCDYCVVFSRDRFAQAIEQAGGSAGGVLLWLREQGYTHVWADFAELSRLSGTYGLPPPLGPDLFARLERAGLKRLHEVRIPIKGVEQIYGILYEVPKP